MGTQRDSTSTFASPVIIARYPLMGDLTVGQTGAMSITFLDQGNNNTKGLEWELSLQAFD